MQNLKKMLLGALFVTALVSCQGVPDFPDVDYGTVIKQTPIESSYAYFVPYYDKREPYAKTLDEFIDMSPVCVSADHYKQIQKHVEKLKKLAERRCK